MFLGKALHLFAILGRLFSKFSLLKEKLGFRHLDFGILGLFCYDNFLMLDIFCYLFLILLEHLFIDFFCPI